MGYNKITNLLGKIDKDEIPKLSTTKWIEIFDQSNGPLIQIKTLDLKHHN